MKFEIGNAVVYKSHGVGKIVARETREFALGNKSEFFIVLFDGTRAPKKCFVPVNQAAELLRPVIDTAAATELVAYLETGTGDVVDHQTWNRRYREYMELIHTGDTMSVAKVYLSLIQLREEQELSFGERTLLNQCETMLSSELALVGLSIPKRGNQGLRFVRGGK